MLQVSQVEKTYIIYCFIIIIYLLLFYKVEVLNV